MSTLKDFIKDVGKGVESGITDTINIIDSSGKCSNFGNDSLKSQASKKGYILGKIIYYSSLWIALTVHVILSDAYFHQCLF